MNKKAQQSPISFLVMMIFTFIIFGIIGGEIFGLFSIAAITGGTTGFISFILYNFGVWAFFIILLGILMYFWRARK